MTGTCQMGRPYSTDQTPFAIGNACGHRLKALEVIKQNLDEDYSALHSVQRTESFKDETSESTSIKGHLE